MPSFRFTYIFKPLNIPVQVQIKSFPNHNFLRMASTLPKLPVFEAIAHHDPKSTAVIHCASGRRFTYGQLLKDVADGREKLLQSAGGEKTDRQKIALLVENSYDYVGATRVTAWKHQVRMTDALQ